MPVMPWRVRALARPAAAWAGLGCPGPGWAAGGNGAGGPGMAWRDAQEGAAGGPGGGGSAGVRGGGAGVVRVIGRGPVLAGVRGPGRDVRRDIGVLVLAGGCAVRAGSRIRETALGHGTCWFP